MQSDNVGRTMKRSWHAMAAMTFVMSAMVLGTAGCASVVRNGLGTSSAVCFRAIPVGKAAVTAHPTQVVPNGSPTSSKRPSPVFVGVRSATQKQINAFGSSHNYEKAELTMRNGGPIKSICLVAFRGPFDPTSISDVLYPVPPPGQRTYAVVVVSEPSNKLLGTFLRSKEPISFTHYAGAELLHAVGGCRAAYAVGGCWADGGTVPPAPLDEALDALLSPDRSARSTLSSWRCTSAQVRGSVSRPSLSARWAFERMTQATLHRIGSVATLATSPASC